jgi:hypothetical protein
MVHPQLMDGGEGLQIWKISANILNKQLWTAERGDPPAWGLGVELRSPHHKKLVCYELSQRALDLKNYLDKLFKLRNIDMRFGTWDVRSLCRAGLLMTVVKEISNYNLDLVGLQVRWDSGGTKPTGKYTFFYGKGNENHNQIQVFFVLKRIISAVKMAEFLSDRLSYTILRRC